MQFALDPIPTSRESVAEDRRRLRRAVAITGWFLVLLWLIALAQWTFGFDPGDFGVRPRIPAGLIGVLTAPLFHSGFGHLFANSSALLVLGVIALRVYPRAMRFGLPLIWIGSGLLVWWLARSSSHIGASGITHGLMFFVFGLGLLRHDRLAIVASMVVFFLYGSMVYTVLPGDPGISWEYHLFGALTGLVAAFLLRGVDPMPVPRQYSWEREDEESLVEGEEVDQEFYDYEEFDLFEPESDFPSRREHADVGDGRRD